MLCSNLLAGVELIRINNERRFKMKISEKQLRGIIREEMGRRSMNEAAAPAAGGNVAYKVQPGDTISGVLKARYGIALSKQNYPLYNQIAKLSGVANADQILGPGTTLQLPATLGGKTRIDTPAAAPGAAGAPGAKGKQCDLPSYKDSLGQALGKIGVTGLAVSATLDVIIFGKFFNLTADALKKAADTLRTFGSTGVQAALGTAAQMLTGGASEVGKNVLIGFFDFWYTLLTGTTNAKIKFSRTCDVATYASETGRAFSSAINAFLGGLKGGMQSAIDFLKTGAQALTELLKNAGLLGLGITVTAISGLLSGLSALINMGAQAAQAAISSAITAAGKMIQSGGAAVTAAGNATQAAGAKVAAAGQAMSESKVRKLQNEKTQRFADDMLQVTRVNTYLARMSPGARALISV
jgi:hypothetical protein